MAATKSKRTTDTESLRSRKAATKPRLKAANSKAQAEGLGIFMIQLVPRPNGPQLDRQISCLNSKISRLCITERSLTRPGNQELTNQIAEFPAFLAS
jgi:hypothetical protein